MAALPDLSTESVDVPALKESGTPLCVARDGDACVVQKETVYATTVGQWESLWTLPLSNRRFPLLSRPPFVNFKRAVTLTFAAFHLQELRLVNLLKPDIGAVLTTVPAHARELQAAWTKEGLRAACFVDPFAEELADAPLVLPPPDRPLTLMWYSPSTGWKEQCTVPRVAERLAISGMQPLRRAPTTSALFPPCSVCVSPCGSLFVSSVPFLSLTLDLSKAMARAVPGQTC
jgi:hypothetical protein